jgi:hypothetical protein
MDINWAENFCHNVVHNASGATQEVIESQISGSRMRFATSSVSSPRQPLASSGHASLPIAMNIARSSASHALAYS